MGGELNADEVHRRLTDPGLSERLTRLRFRDDDAAEVLALIESVAADLELLEILARYADRLINLIGDFHQHPDVWDDIPVPPELPAGALPMLALLASADEVTRWHRGRGISDDDSDAALADLGQQVFVHRLVYGTFGLHNHGWVTWSWSGAFYWLGRLQFNLQQTQLPDRETPQWVLSTHIPRMGPLDAGSLEDSFDQARDFFGRHFADYDAGFFYCESWLLDPALPQRLPGTNLAAFQRRWAPFGETRSGDEDVLFFVFDRRPDSPSTGQALPSTTSLHRVAAAKVGSPDPWLVVQGVIPLQQSTRTGHILGTLLPGFLGPTLPGWLASLLRRGLAGVCLFGQNIETPAQTRRLTDAIVAANPDAIIAIDEEGGDVTRLHYRTGSPYPGNAVLGRLDDRSLTRASGAEVGQALREAGCNVTFAPSVDINSNPDNPVIGVRSFGTDPARVAAHGAAWIEGLQTSGVAATAKHFPGHGDTDADSHVALPRVDRSLAALNDREIVPFRAAIRAGTELVMTSHILLPQLDPDRPATMSPVILGSLRDDLGFDGVIVTDALDMAGAQAALDPASPQGLPGAALASLAAGCDLLCLGTENTQDEVDRIVAAVTAATKLDQEILDRVADAADRVRRLGEKLHARRQDRVAALPRAVDEESVVAAFELQPGVRIPRLSDATVIRVEADASLAIGRTPWAPNLSAAAENLVIDPRRDEVPTLSRERPIIVLGRNLHRDEAMAKIIERLRRDHDQTLVVEMGWPSDDRRYADLATFGASTLVGDALTRYLQRGGAGVG